MSRKGPFEKSYKFCDECKYLREGYRYNNRVMYCVELNDRTLREVAGKVFTPNDCPYETEETVFKNMNIDDIEFNCLVELLKFNLKQRMFVTCSLILKHIMTLNIDIQTLNNILKECDKFNHSFKDFKSYVYRKDKLFKAEMSQNS